MMKPFILIFTLFCTSCTTPTFKAFQKKHPTEVFSSKVDPRVKNCVSDYEARKKLPNGSLYGESVRKYSLQGKRVSEVRSDLEKMGCHFKADVLKEPKKNQPILYQNHTIPLWVFLCSDGGFVRVKPQGDPTDLKHPDVVGSKGLRYPYDSTFENFGDEVVKVDNEGLAVPKWGADLGPKDLIQGWGQDAHTVLKGSGL